MLERDVGDGGVIPECQAQFTLATGVSLPVGLTRLFFSSEGVFSEQETLAFNEFLQKVSKGIGRQKESLPEPDASNFAQWQATFENLILLTKRGIHPFLPVQEEKTNKEGEVVDTALTKFEDRKEKEPMTDYRLIALSAGRLCMTASYVLKQMTAVGDDEFIAACEAKMDDCKARVVLGLEIFLSGITPADCPVFPDETYMPSKNGPCAVIPPKPAPSSPR